MLASTSNRLKDRGLGGGSTGISSGRFTFKSSQTADEVQLPAGTDQQLSKLIDAVCDDMGEGMRSSLINMLEPVREDGASELFVELHEHRGPRAGNYLRFVDNVQTSRFLKKLGYEDLEQFEGSTLTPYTAGGCGVPPELFDGVDHYQKLCDDAGLTSLLHLTRNQDEEVLRTWNPGQYNDVQSANLGLKEAITPGYGAEIAKLQGLKRAEQYHRLIFGWATSAESILEFVEVLGEDKADPDSIMAWTHRRVSAGMLREYGQSVCRKYSAADLATGRVPAKTLRSASRSLPLFSYQDLAELNRRVNISGIQPSALKKYGELVRPDGNTAKTQSDRLCALMSTGADPDDIRVIKDLSTSDDSQDAILRAAKICAAGINTEEALKRYVGSASGGYVSVKTNRTDYLTVAESALAARFKASDVEAFVQAGCDLGHLASARATDDLWEFGAAAREEFAADYGRPWPITEEDYRKSHDGRPILGSLLD